MQSVLGSGTTIHVYLPVTDAAPAPRLSEAASEREPASLRGSETIVVAEDNDGVRRLVSDVLEGQGYEVLSATDGSAALAIVESLGRPIDLLLTDVMMPEMKGADLTVG